MDFDNFSDSLARQTLNSSVSTEREWRDQFGVWYGAPRPYKTSDKSSGAVITFPSHRCLQTTLSRRAARIMPTIFSTRCEAVNHGPPNLRCARRQPRFLTILTWPRGGYVHRPPFSESWKPPVANSALHPHRSREKSVPAGGSDPQWNDFEVDPNFEHPRRTHHDSQ